MNNFLIFGFASSGESALNLIIKKCKYNRIFIYDDLEQIRNKAQNLTKSMPNIYVLNKITPEIAKEVSKVILSPGVSIYNKWVQFFKMKKIEVVSELEFGFSLQHKKLIAITGTNGKTTCVKLLNTILNCAHKKSIAVGNVGYPISKAVLNNQKQKYFVCEVSSFQLEAIKNFKPQIACVLNITSDHLNRHKTFLNYKKTKLNIAKNLSKNNYFVTNINIKTNKLGVKNYKFGINNMSFGAYCQNEKIYFRNNKKQIEVCNIKDINLIGQHNLENALAVITICKILKIKNKHIIKGFKIFKLDKHRIELIYTKNGVEFYDDSKATNVDATIKAINCFKNKNIYLLLGGSDKGFQFDDIFKNMQSNVKQVVCFGEVGNKIKQTANKYNKQAIYFQTLKSATEYCLNDSQSGDVVLLSPANASFDEFSSYKDRGEKFLQYIKDYFN